MRVRASISDRNPGLGAHTSDPGRAGPQTWAKKAGLVSGYRGSPLAAVDVALLQAKTLLDANCIDFVPAINEDLAATIILGTQQVETDDDRLVNGVFISFFMPTLNPANIAEYLEFGLWGYALSRYSGCWVGFKTVPETVESAASVELPPLPDFVTPDDFTPPETGLHYRWPDLPGPQLQTRIEHKLAAVQAFARANPIDRCLFNEPNARFGIVTTGKRHLDLPEALDLLGIDETHAKDIGLDIYKVGLVWPLERSGILKFVHDKEEVLVAEEKRGIIESQIKEAMSEPDHPGDVLITGKQDELGRKRKIDQPSCNKDFSCVNGFCPSFATIEGGQLRKSRGTDADSVLTGKLTTIPEPVLPALTGSYDLLVGGVGGTGVVTVGQLITMAAHLEGLGTSVRLNANGIAEKLMGDTVFSNVMMLGFAWQRGLLPLSQASLIKAIELNGVAIDRNKEAFGWGRVAATDLKAITDLLNTGEARAEDVSSTPGCSGHSGCWRSFGC